MAILYSKRNVKAFNHSEPQFAIVAKALGSVGINELAREMSAESTVTRHDVKAVLSSLEDHIMRHLRNGNTVQLGDLGSFHLTFNSTLVDDPELVSPSQIKGVKIRFTPSKALKNALKPTSDYISFKPYYPSEKEEIVEPEEGEDITDAEIVTTEITDNQ